MQYWLIVTSPANFKHGRDDIGTTMLTENGDSRKAFSAGIVAATCGWRRSWTGSTG